MTTTAQCSASAKPAYGFPHLVYATRLMSGRTSFAFSRVSEWQAKRDAIAVMLGNMPSLVKAHVTRQEWAHSESPKMSTVDYVPTIRLASACESIANALYAMADIAASFGHLVSKQALTNRFNALQKCCAEGKNADLAKCLGDLSSYRKVRELRTEWVHHSSIFVAEDDKGEPMLVVRCYRRVSDRVEFKGEKTFSSVAQLCGWVSEAVAMLDRFAGFLLERYVLPGFDPDQVFTDLVRAENGLPKTDAEGKFVFEKLTTRAYLARFGITLPKGSGC